MQKSIHRKMALFSIHYVRNKYQHQVYVIQNNVHYKYVEEKTNENMNEYKCVYD